MKVDEKDEDESVKHAELLALPPHGSEIYVGGIPSDASEEDLKNFCKSVGEVVEVRLIKDKGSSENKGYAFVTYLTKELAEKATEDLNNTEFKGKKIKCSTAQKKHRLFIGNVPKNWTEKDMKTTVSNVGPGVTAVQLMKDPQNSSCNRGFAFIEYYNGACAEYSRKKMSSSDFKLDDRTPTVSWADPRSGNSASSFQVKSVYVKHLPKNVTQDQLRRLFEHHGRITKVVLPPAKAGQENRIGFVHFEERSSVMKALKNTERYEIDGQVLDCSLAKPPASERQSANTGSNALKGPLLPNYPLGYGLIGGTYSTLPAAYRQPMVYGNPGVAMVPMILPDGRLGYVMQQPRPSDHRSVSRRGSSNGGRQNNDGSRGRRYQPY
ncbi:uncharacterized protein A4U43_C01F23360 [Asparagus officinalis]|uniref:RRM domain-containing protein n=2 Tax=Asparagus officinalis TaxID=4686 RepID=A0A5P1FVS8_ASPOF|nr:uncharacterized protein A4U43_C01F23360 [Asparagus officinalis]